MERWNVDIIMKFSFLISMLKGLMDTYFTAFYTENYKTTSVTSVWHIIWGAHIFS